MNIDQRFLSTLLSLELDGSNSLIRKNAQRLMQCRVDPNPHQIEAVNFAIQRMNQTGVLLADEVGLGKTIEAGLIIKDMIERKADARIIIACPNALLEQWQDELKKLFLLSSTIFTSPSEFQNFTKGIGIVTDHVLANSKKIKDESFDLCVIDEAHRFRNWYVEGNKKYNTLINNIRHIKKILLTATPIQTKIEDYYSLISIIENSPENRVYQLANQFGVGSSVDTDSLEDFSKSFFYRNLRKDVISVSYPPRKVFPRVIPEPLPNEKKSLVLIEEYISKHLSKKKGGGLLKSSYLKFYTSSPQMFYCVLLKSLQSVSLSPDQNNRMSILLNDILAKGWISSTDLLIPGIENENLNFEEIENRLNLLEVLKESICSSKLEELKLIVSGLLSNKKVCPAERIVIFTQYVTSQNIILNSLKEIGIYSDEVVIFNGETKDRKLAVQQFRTKAKVLIITDAGCFGLNLQFCNCLINFDIPWNPMTVEQRIGRIHRYGQKNTANIFNIVQGFLAFEKEMYEKIFERCKLAEEQFGASNEILVELQSINNAEDFFDLIDSNQLTPQEILDQYNQRISLVETELHNSKIAMLSHISSIFNKSTQSVLKINQKDLEEEVKKISIFLKDLISLKFRDVNWDANKFTFSNSRPLTLPLCAPGQYYEIWDPLIPPSSDRSIIIGLESPFIRDLISSTVEEWSFQTRNRFKISPAVGDLDSKMVFTFFNFYEILDSNIHLEEIPISSGEISKEQAIMVWNKLLNFHDSELKALKDRFKALAKANNFTQEKIESEKLRLKILIGNK